MVPPGGPPNCKQPQEQRTAEAGELLHVPFIWGDKFKGFSRPLFTRPQKEARRKEALSLSPRKCVGRGRRLATGKGRGRKEGAAGRQLSIMRAPFLLEC